MIKVIFFSVFLLASFFMFPIGKAQSCDCNAALTQDIYSYEMEYNEALATLDLLDHETWSSIGRKGGFGINFPIKSIPIGVNSTWDNFKQFRTNLFQKHSYQSNQSSSKSIFIKATKERGYDSFDNCIKTCFGTGLFLYVTESDKNYVHLQIKYTSPISEAANMPDLKIISSTLINGTTESGNSSQLVANGLIFKIGDDQTIIIKRTIKEDDIQISINAEKITGGTRSTSIKIAGFKEIENNHQGSLPLPNQIISNSYIKLKAKTENAWIYIDSPRGAGDVLSGPSPSTLVIVKTEASGGEVINSNNYIKIRGTNGDPWFYIDSPRGPGNVVAGDSQSAASLFIVKVGGSEGETIRDGDEVKIRGTAGDPWFYVNTFGTGNLLAGEISQASTFIIQIIK